MDNFFEITGIGKLEAVHSNMLDWLFENDKDHGLGNLFLEEFLKVSGIRNFDFTKVSVRTEVPASKSLSGRMDIFIESLNYLICIENKIESKDHDKQLSRYKAHLEAEQRIMQKNQKEVKIALIYLTPMGNEPVECGDGWICVGYEEVKKILEEKITGKINERYRTLIEDYIQVLKDVVLQIGKDEETNRKIIKFLNENIIKDLKEKNYQLFQRNGKALTVFPESYSDKIDFDAETFGWKNIAVKKNENSYFAFEFSDSVKQTVKYGIMRKGSKGRLSWTNCKKAQNFLDETSDIFEEKDNEVRVLYLKPADKDYSKLLAWLETEYQNGSLRSKIDSLLEKFFCQNEV